MDSVQQAILNAIAVTLTALIGLVTSKVVSWLEEKKVTEKIFNKREIVGIVVSAIEQIYKAEDGPKKLQQAKLMAVEMLNQNGIKVTENELNALIEEAVGNINQSTSDSSELIEIDSNGKLEWVEDVDLDVLSIPLKSEEINNNEELELAKEKERKKQEIIENLIEQKEELIKSLDSIESELENLK